MQNPKIVLIDGQQRYDVRAFFRKEGRAKYISHLDLYRTMQRAFSRSGLKVWFTDGYNPKIYLNFAMPISLGFEGAREAFDFRLMEDMEETEVLNALNRVLPEGIVITEVQSPVKKVTDIAESEYSLTLTAHNIPPAELKQKLAEFFRQEAILTEKRTKKGMKQVDIRPMIHRWEILSGEHLELKLTLPSGVAVNLNPMLVIDTFAARAGIEVDYRNIRRDRILCADGTDFR